MHAWHVVGGIAHQGLEVDHLGRRNAEFALHSGGIASFAIHRVDYGDVRIHQLAQILVAAGDDDVDALSGRGFGQGANDIVGLHALNGQHFPALQAHQFVNGVELAAQIIGHGRAVALVVGIERVAKSFTLGVEHAGRPDGWIFLGQRLHHVDHDAQRARGLAAAVGQGHAPVAAGMEGPVEVTGTIDQQQHGIGGRGGWLDGVVGVHCGIVPAFLHASTSAGSPGARPDAPGRADQKQPGPAA